MGSNLKHVSVFSISLIFSITSAHAGMVNTSSSSGSSGSGSNGDYNSSSTGGTVVSSPATSSGSGIQQPANNAGSQQQTGTMISSAALGVGVAGTAATCNNPTTASACTYFTYGTIVSAVAMVGMQLAQSKSNSSKGATSSGYKGSGNYEQDAMEMLAKDPNYQKYQALKPKLDQAGYKIDEKKGTWYDPNKKKTLSTSDFKDSSSMSRAGFSKSEQDGFNSVMGQMKKDVNAVVKSKGLGADGGIGGDLGVGGGGGGTAAASTTGEAGTGAAGAGQPTLSINRDPAQVAGMTKSYNGEMIGVSGDSLFDMMNRRYNLHKSKGAFLDNQ